VAAHHRELTEKLDAVVYEAQKIPTFATIWEQRRTTTAVIEGFRNLEDAVDRMAKGLDSSLDGLGASLAASSDDVTRALRGLHEDSIAAAQGQLSATRELSSRAGEIRDHLYYPELSRWLH